MPTETLKNHEIMTMQGALVELVRVPMPVRYGWPAQKVANKLAKAMDEINQARDRLIRNYGKEEGGQVKVAPDAPNRTEFDKELKELMDAEQTIEFDPIALPEDLVLPMASLMALDRFLVAPVTTEAKAKK